MLLIEGRSWFGGTCGSSAINAKNIFILTFFSLWILIVIDLFFFPFVSYPFLSADFCDSCFRTFDFNVWSLRFGGLVPNIAQFKFVFHIFKVIILFHLFQIVLILCIYFRGLISHLLLLMQSWQNYVSESFWFIVLIFLSNDRCNIRV
jgi:hypothetical protein